MTNTKGKITLLICLVLSLVMMFVLSSCDNAGTSSNDTTSNTGSNTDSTYISVTDVYFEESVISLEIGETEELVATVSPWNANDTSLTYSSSNNFVAVVQNGKIYALGEGVALITATASNGKQANCIVTVNKKAVEDDTPSTPLPDNTTVDVSEVVLNSSNIELDEGDTYTLTATVYPRNATDNTIIWKSSSSSVVTVDNGVVKAISSGTATITATASNGVSASCTVKVSEKLYFVFEEYGSGYTVVEYIGTSTNVAIPSTYNGKKVIAIGTEDGNKGFYKNYDVVSVVLPDTIKEINAGAFYNCGSLESITIPSSVTTIRTDAFSGSTNIKNATIPTTAISYIPKNSLQTVVINGGTSIGSYAFAYCPALASVTIGDSVTSIENYAFADCDSLTSVTIPDSVTSIGSDAFADCDSLTSITIPDSVTSIGWYAFRYCDSLTSVAIGDSVMSIGNSAFEDCTSLTSVTIGDSVTSIGSDAFDGCTSLVEINFNATAMNDKSSKNYVFSNAGKNGDGIKVTIGKNVTKIPAYLFYTYPYLNSPKITSVVFEKGSICESIGTSAFSSCASLTSVTIPDSVTSIGHSAFHNCDSLTSVTIGNSVTSIGESAFSSCASLTSVTIGDSVTSIGSNAFDGCTSLTIITIPDSVTSIGIFAFEGCTSLTSVTIPDSVTSIGGNAFEGCTSLTSVTIGDSVTSIGSDAFCDCTSLTEINFNATAMNDINSSKDSVFSNAGKNGDGIKVTIGKNVTKIPAYLFYPFNNTSYSPKITSVVFEEGSVCESVGYRAFSNCTSLTSVTIGDSVTSIGEAAFEGCTSLTSVAIGDSVMSIGDFAFSDCVNLTSVTIGNSVTSIGFLAFDGCTSLTSVEFGDTTGWYVTKTYGATSGVSVVVSYSSDNAMYLKYTYVGYYWYKK